MLYDLRLSPDESALLNAYRFDEAAFAGLRQRLTDGAFTPEHNRLTAEVKPPPAEAIVAWPTDGSDEAEQCERLGQAAMDAGEVAVVLLNGGMATRFGGVVKGVVEVIDGKSFLGLRLGDIAAECPKAHVFVMNSFATAEATREHLTGWENFGIQAGQLHFIEQGISVRLTPEGKVFRDAKRRVSFYAPGHGDVFAALRASPDFVAWQKGGGRYVWISNIDNLGATLSARALGLHIARQKAVSVEVAERYAGDAGGAPALVDDKVMLVEGMRMPEDFPVETLTVFNTNTLMVNVETVAQEHPLTWIRADKKVDDDSVVQFERLMGEVTAFVDSVYLEVPREGADSRFMPVKTPADLDAMRPQVRARYAHVLG